MVEQAFHKRQVVGSTPALDTKRSVVTEEVWGTSERESKPD